MNPFGTTVLLLPDFMVGAIIIWSGLVSAIPANWQLCDGTNGTPDLRSRFVHGASADGNVGDTAGAENHVHPFTGDGHDHDLTSGFGVEAGALLGTDTTTDPATGTTDLTSNMPPYYRLAYIQRMSL